MMENKQFEMKAMEADVAEAEKISEFSPSGEYKKDTVNRFIRSLNEMLKHFAAPMIGEVADDIDGPLPPEVVKALFMIDAALEDAKMDEHRIDMDDLKTDRDLMMARGKIDAGAKDRAFIAFLRKPMGEVDDVETNVEISIQEGDDVVPPGFHRMPDGSIMSDDDPSMKGGSYGEEDDMETLMMKRMR
tara:strand:+ start:1015 stop:1578 length:564 start_codon:yes stop_codon:yes gene_type:complete